MPPRESPRPNGAMPTQDPARDLAGALHEVSNALTVALAWLDVAQSSSSPSGTSEAIAIAMRRARDGQRIARLAIGAETPQIDDLLTLGALVREAVMGVTPLAGAREVTLVSEVTSASAPVFAPSAALQILTNLLLNAISFTPAGGKVAVEASLSSGSVRLEVQDDGPGIPEDQRDHVFVRGRSTREGGAGIGLVHALAMAEHHGGSLELLESRADEGARFHLRWPSRSERRSSAPPAPPTGKRLDGSRVLVVEDDPMLVVLLEASLTARGAQVTTANGGAELTILLGRTGAFDRILLDLSPMGDNVVGHMHAIGEHSPSARIVVISGSAAALPPTGVPKVYAWVRKPFDLSELLGVLSEP